MADPLELIRRARQKSWFYKETSSTTKAKHCCMHWQQQHRHRHHLFTGDGGNTSCEFSVVHQS